MTQKPTTPMTACNNPIIKGMSKVTIHAGV